MKICLLLQIFNFLYYKIKLYNARNNQFICARNQCLSKYVSSFPFALSNY